MKGRQLMVGSAGKTEEAEKLKELENALLGAACEATYYYGKEYTMTSKNMKASFVKYRISDLATLENGTVLIEHGKSALEVSLK